MHTNKILPCLILVFLLLFSSSCLAHGKAALRGPAFSDPAKIYRLNDAWQKKPIIHDDWAQDADLAISLDQHLYPALLPLIKRFAKEKKLIIKVQEGTCGISAGKILEKSADIGGFCCPPGEDDRLPGLTYHTLGIAALGIIVNAQNPVDNLTMKQLRDIFQGRINCWKLLPGQTETSIDSCRIRPFIRLHCKSRPGHWRLLLDNEDLFSPRLQEVGTIRDMVSNVAGQLHGIGYEVLWHINKHEQHDMVKSIKINGADPANPANLTSLAYPLYRTFNITTWENAPDKKTVAHQLVTYIQDHMDEIDKSFNLIPAIMLRKAGWQFKDDELIGEPQ